MRNDHKFHSLDGLRGLAALSVVILHYTLAFAPFLIGYSITVRHTRFDHLISTTPLLLPFMGNFAVCIFFVLSGFVLSISYFRHKNISVIISSAARRYFRLALPAIVSVLVVYLVLLFGGVHNQQTYRLTESNVWLAQFWSFPAHIGEALFQGLYGVFFTNFDNYPISYNPVLWTMHFELYGSFLVFMFLAFFGKLTKRWIFYALFSLIFLQTYYLAFIAGVALADIMLNYPLVKDRVRDGYVWGLLPVGLVLGSWETTGIYPTIYNKIHVPLFTTVELELLAHILGAIIVMIAVLKLRMIARVLETRLIQYLGRVSYSLYLTHIIIIGSLACFLFDKFYPHYGYKLSLIMMFAPSMAVTFFVATLYTRYVDAVSVGVSKQIGNYLTGDSRLSFDGLKLWQKVPLVKAQTESIIVPAPEE